VDLYTGRRIAFGAPDAPACGLPEAVLASTSIPGLFPPVRIGGRQMVDGGIHSGTSLDLATEWGADKILCVAPLGYKREGESALDLRSLPPRLVRTPFARSLRREAVQARSRGRDVLVIRPSLEELRQHGTNSMRHADRAAITDAAVRSTRRILESERSHPVIEAFKSKPRERTG
jgi:NTE family protein